MFFIDNFSEMSALWQQQMEWRRTLHLSTPKKDAESTISPKQLKFSISDFDEGLKNQNISITMSSDI